MKNNEIEKILSDEGSRKVVQYFSSLESRFCYTYLLGGAMHFGYYPTESTDITEKKAQYLFNELVAENLKIKKDDYILDAGCGQGVVSAHLAKKYNCRIVGINIIPFQVAKAKILAKRESVEDKVQYRLMDYSDTDFENETFDAVYTTESLSHAADLEKTLKEFMRILKPNGRVALFEYTIAQDGQFDEYEKKMLDAIIEGAAMMSLKQFRHDTFPEFLGKIGFTGIREQNISSHMAPSLARLHRILAPLYFIVRFFNAQRLFPNIAASHEYYKMAKKGLIRYCIFTANKPA
ncbi:MAG: hypothetical protein A2939_02295 [Parcubacteria group bacterium RIFCSPLOWO2_01_FULL_48_18]|nr:MAG: hypothetical protein A3J67_02490 [Parcubacteria group bacterium RIFCSPHIGHO2_02_FULL_48_10b]OHB23220.1 MAG: hypothetical protein A2939_02295 [Parcubacteria group bacterium RIFCSPLOWO2_01_FULL_48_18]